MKNEKMKKLRCENVKKKRMIVIFTETFIANSHHSQQVFSIVIPIHNRNISSIVKSYSNLFLDPTSTKQ